MVYSRIKQLYFDDTKASSTSSAKKELTDQNCTACRFISGGGLTMLGIYVIKRFYDDIQLDKSKFKFSIKNNKSNSVYGFILGAFFLSLGFARLANFHFRN